MKNKIKPLFSKFSYVLFSAAIIVSQSPDNKKISIFLNGNNMEYIYGKEFLKIKDEITKKFQDLISVLRFPGGELSDGYSWLDGIGPVDKRGVTRNSDRSVEYFNDLGTDEIVTFCRQIGAEPLLTANFKKGSPDEAKAWVEYCNGIVPVEGIDNQIVQKSIIGIKKNRNFNAVPANYFSLLRSFNGNKDPFNVKFWEIGNEVYSDPAITPKDYASGVIEFSDKMKSASKQIKIGVCFNDYKLAWNDELMARARDYIDFVCPHLYGGVFRSPIGFSFYSNGFISKQVNFKYLNKLSIFFDSYGDEYLGYPILEIRVDGNVAKQLEIKSKSYYSYEVELGEFIGAHKISLGFVNDLAFARGQDRNLFIKNIFFTQDGNKQLLFDNKDEYFSLFAANEDLEQKIINIKAYLKQKLCKARIAITEGNVNYGLGSQFDRAQTKEGAKLKSALFVAGLLNSCIRQDVWMFNYWNLLTTGYYGLFRPDGHVIPSYYVMKMYGNNLGSELVDISLTSPIFENGGDIQVQTGQKTVNYLDGIGTIDSKHSKINLMVINRDSERAIEAAISLNGFHVDVSEDASIRVLSDSDGKGMEADNETDPQNVVIKEVKMKLVSGKFNFKFQPHSLTNLEIPLISK